MLHHLLTLARVSNLPTVWSNCLAAWLISGIAPTWALLPLMLGASLLYAGGCTLNDACDASWDARHRPERLIPSGVLSRRAVWGIGLTEMAAGLAAIFAAGVSVWWPAPALAAAILLYDAWHKQSPLSVIIMGACRWLLYLTAASVAGGNFRPVMICGGVLWLYIIVLSLVARGEAKRGASVPRTRHLLFLIPVAVFVAAWFGSSDVFHWCSLALVSIAGIDELLPETRAPVGQWVNRLLAGIPFIDLCLILTLAAPPVPFLSLWTLAFPVAIALSFLFQRWFKAT